MYCRHDLTSLSCQVLTPPSYSNVMQTITFTAPRLAALATLWNASTSGSSFGDAPRPFSAARSKQSVTIGTRCLWWWMRPNRLPRPSPGRSRTRRQSEAFRDLERGHFLALGPALSRRSLGLRIGPTITQPRNTAPRLLPLPEAAVENAREVILAAPPPEAPKPQRRSLPPAAPDLLSQLMAARPSGADNSSSSQEVPLSSEEQATRRLRLDHILQAILADPEAGFRTIGVLYQDFLVRCRIEGLGAGAPDLAAFRRMLIHARAGISTEMAEDALWLDVAARAALLPEDMQGIFMMIAVAAREGRPCPSDAAIARAYGTRSLGRARRVLGYMEEQGLALCHQGCHFSEQLWLPMVAHRTFILSQTAGL